MAEQFDDVIEDIEKDQGVKDSTPFETESFAEIDARDKAKARAEAIEVSDEEYKAQSVPKKPSDYQIDDKVREAEDFDPDLLSSFQELAHSERLTQGQLEKTIAWWNKARTKFGSTDFGQDFVDAFMVFATKQRISPSQITGLKKWFTGIRERDKRQLEKVKKFAVRSGANNDAGRLAAISQIQQSKSYRSKGDTAAERAAHKRAVARMHQLTQAQGG